MPCSSFQIDKKAEGFFYPQLYKCTTPLVRALHLVVAGPLSTPTTGSETVAAVGGCRGGQIPGQHTAASARETCATTTTQDFVTRDEDSCFVTE